MAPSPRRPYQAPERRREDGALTAGDRFSAIDEELSQLRRTLDTHGQQLSRLWGGLAVIAAEVPLVLFLAEWLARGR